MTELSNVWVVDHWSRLRPGGGSTRSDGYTDTGAATRALLEKVGTIEDHDGGLKRTVTLLPSDHCCYVVELTRTGTDRFGRPAEIVEHRLQAIRLLDYEARHKRMAAA